MVRLLDAPNTRVPTGLRNRCILELMYRAGLRVGEVCALKHRDLDLERGLIHVWAGKGGDGTAYLEKEPEALARMREWQTARRKLPKSDWLFCTLAGGPVSSRYVQQMIKRMAKRAEIDARVTPHMLRHSFATELLEEGVNIRKVQRALRHKNLATTERYTHVLDSDLQSSIQNRKRPKRPKR
jgi:integrase/recombinase XerC